MARRPAAYEGRSGSPFIGTPNNEAAEEAFRDSFEDMVLIAFNHWDDESQPSRFRAEDVKFGIALQKESDSLLSVTLSGIESPEVQKGAFDKLCEAFERAKNNPESELYDNVTVRGFSKVAVRLWDETKEYDF